MEIAITKYTPIFSVLVGAVVVLEAALGVLGISKRVGGAVVERMPIQLRILLQVKVLGEGEVFRGGMVRV